MDGRENEPAYITKYALTTGIVPCKEGYFAEDGYYHGKPPGHRWGNVYSKKEAHRTPEAAIADAERRKAEKIQSLKKQIRKLEAFPIQVKSDD